VRIANLAGRAVIALDGGAVDVHEASGGRFGPALQSVYEQWTEFRAWAEGAELTATAPLATDDLGAPSPTPPQTFAIGLNYRAHAAESGLTVPDDLTVFTKYVSSFMGPTGDIPLPAGKVDWEIELVVVIGTGGRSIPVERAWDHVAGITAGQDLSERVLQTSGPSPQFSLAKSHEGFAPTGPWLVTVDEFADPDDLELRTEINGEVLQRSRTSDLVFSVPQIIARLSEIVELRAGDVIFTGTPEGVGFGMSPQRFLAVGDVLTSAVEGVGEMTHRFVASN
jgi:2-keto-4-pentenoate hydratase/2-oxohepta-3-ene-1,7-dioic acid hydratase (catechol pathway)